MSKLSERWKELSAHNIWSKVIAGVILAGVLGIIGSFFVWLFGNNTAPKFWSYLTVLINYKLPLWSYFIATLIVLVVLRLFAKQRIKQKTSKLPSGRRLYNPIATPSKKAPEPVDQSPALPETLEPLTGPSSSHLLLQDYVNLQGTFSTVIDSNKAGEGAYISYGDHAWNDELMKLEGPKGAGSLGVHNGILEIRRTNFDGRFIVKLNGYYPPDTVGYIFSYTLGRSPRSFTFNFLARAIKGSHKIIVAFKKQKSGHLISSFYLLIHNVDWEPQSGGFNVSAEEDFFIEFQCLMMDEVNGILQIKNILIKERH